MPSLQKTLAEIRELDVSELEEVGGGLFYYAELTTTCYTDSHDVEHCVSNRDP